MIYKNDIVLKVWFSNSLSIKHILVERGFQELIRFISSLKKSGSFEEWTVSF